MMNVFQTYPIEEDTFGDADENLFEAYEVIGSGTYGIVFRGLEKNTNDIVAIKQIKFEVESEGIPSTALREISILRDFNHPNIVKLKHVVWNDTKLQLIFEFLDKDLKKFIDSKEPNEYLDPKFVKFLLKQILHGVAYCHSMRIIHRDLKPANILLDEFGNLKIADFGLARAFSIPIRPYTKEVLTMWYRAPEILLGAAEYSTAVDIWSVGCIFAELITKKTLFQGNYEIDQIFQIFKILGNPITKWADVKNLPNFKESYPKFVPFTLEKLLEGYLNSDGIDLLSKMLTYDPSLRISAKQALLHPYFKTD